MGIVRLSPFHSTEGLTLDVLLRLTRSSLLSPAFSSLTVLASLTRQLSRLYPSLSGLSWSALVEASKSWEVGIAVGVFTAGVLLRADEQLSRAARNNYTRGSRAKWDWDGAGGGKGEVVVVTGGAGGLGSEVVRRLAARKGTKVVVLDVAPLFSGAGENVKYYKVDLMDPETIKEAAEKVLKEVGQPSVLVNMAGVVRAKSILESTPQDVDLTYDINVKAHYYTVQAFLPHMIKEGKGHVVTIASAMSYVQAVNGVSYCSSKAAALSFHEGLTEELRHLYQPSHLARAVRTSVICPAHFKSEMFAGFESNIPEFFAPSLEIGTVAKLVVETVWSGESQHIIEPFYCKPTPLARGLPTWLYGAILGFAKDAMGHVKEHKSKTQ